MHGMSTTEISTVFLALGVMLAAARILGEIVRRFNQPAVLGELAAGIVLGPTLMGSFWPEATATLFPAQGPVAIAMEAFTAVAISLFLLVAGMEVNLSTAWRQGRVAIYVSAGGIALPFTLGFVAAILIPTLGGREAGSGEWIFAFFLATALSISALPVIAKTLMDLNLYRSDLGMIVIAAAVLNDLIGWLAFALILGLAGGAAHETMHIGWIILTTLGFAAFVLTIGRGAIHRMLPWIQAHTVWPGGVLGLALSLGFLGAAFTQWIGVHAIFGSFLVGVAIGDSSHLREHTRAIIHQFISFIFAPLFFASIGVRIDFVSNFDLPLTLLLLGIVCFGKIFGCRLVSQYAGVGRREAWAIGFAMCAGGAMAIIFGLLGLQTGLIGERMFVSLVVMAIATSMISGPAMRRVLRLRQPRRLTDFLSPKACVIDLPSQSRSGAIRALSAAACKANTSLKPEQVAELVLAREAQAATGLGDRIAVPHARLEGLQRPLIAIGLCDGGVDFDAPDGAAAQIILLILTPRDDDGAQVEILADVARTFREESIRQRAVEVRTYIELLALLRTGEGD